MTIIIVNRLDFIPHHLSVMFMLNVVICTCV